MLTSCLTVYTWLPVSYIYIIAYSVCLSVGVLTHSLRYSFLSVKYFCQYVPFISFVYTSACLYVCFIYFGGFSVVVCYPFFRLSHSACIRMSVCLSICLISQPVCLSDCLLLHATFTIDACLYLSNSLHLSTYLSVCFVKLSSYLLAS